MNVTFKIGEVINGFKVVDRIGLSRFVVENDDIRIVFDTDAGEGVNYSKIIGYYNRKTERSYRAMRYLLKYVSTVQGLSNVLYQRYKTENK